MKILKEGKPQGDVMYFKCRVCGCEFLADSTEYASVWDGGKNELLCRINCPTLGCGIKVYGQELKEAAR